MTAIFLHETGLKEFAEVDASSKVLAAHDRNDDAKPAVQDTPAAAAVNLADQTSSSEVVPAVVV